MAAAVVGVVPPENAVFVRAVVEAPFLKPDMLHRPVFACPTPPIADEFDGPPKNDLDTVMRVGVPRN